jgi:hypothetical protein
MDPLVQQIRRMPQADAQRRKQSLLRQYINVSRSMTAAAERCRMRPLQGVLQEPIMCSSKLCSCDDDTFVWGTGNEAGWACNL